MLRIPFKKPYHKKTEENSVCEIMIRKNNQNQFLETFISIKFDAECNETTPAISFGRFYEDFYISQTYHQMLSP